MNTNQEQPFTGSVSELIQKYGLVKVNAKLRSVIAQGIGGSNFFSHHPGYYVNFFAQSTNDVTTGPSVKIQVSKLMGEIICTVEKRIETSGDEDKKLLIRHLNNHPARNGNDQESHMTFVRDDFDTMASVVLESALTSMSSLVRLHESR